MGVERYMILNGELTSWQEVEGAYVYQYIHTLDYVARNIKQHLKILNQSSQALFSTPFCPTAKEIEQSIVTLLSQAHISRKVSVRVTIKHFATGDTTIEYDTPSIYSGYVMRSLRPEAICLRINPPLEAYPTSAAVATFQMAEAIAQARGYHTAIMVDGDNVIRSDSSHPVAIVRGKTVILPATTILSVEREILEQATRRAGYELRYEALHQADLTSADEVLIMSWQGVSAVEHINGKPYMAILAERIAKEFNK